MAGLGGVLEEGGLAWDWEGIWWVDGALVDACRWGGVLLIGVVEGLKDMCLFLGQVVGVVVGQVGEWSLCEEECGCGCWGG